jgi:hypothetical protein
VVRYIGKGSTTRARAHMRLVIGIARRRAAGEAVKTSHFYNRLTKAWLNGAEIQEVIIVNGLTDKEAYEREIVEISSAPQGQLWNVWSGGEGGSKGHIKTPEQRQQIAETNRKTWCDPKLINEQSDRMKVHWLRPEYRAVLAKPRGKSKRGSEAAYRRWANSEYRAKMERTHNDPEFTLRRSEATKRGWQTRRAKQ